MFLFQVPEDAKKGTVYSVDVSSDNWNAVSAWVDTYTGSITVVNGAEPALFGDVDQNGKIQIVDALAALKAAAAIMAEDEPEITPEQLEIANVDGKGKVTVLDAQCILIYAANTMSDIPTTWQEVTGNPNAPTYSNLGEN